MTVALYAHCTVLKIIIVKFQKHLDRNYRERNLLNVSKYDKKNCFVYKQRAMCGISDYSAVQLVLGLLNILATLE